MVLMLEPARAFGLDLTLPGWLLYMSLSWAILGALIVHLIGWKLIAFSFARQRYEADLRRAALHVRENAESVAVYNAEPSEEANMLDRFHRVKSVQWQQMLYTKRLSFFTSSYNFAQYMVPFIILAP